MKQKAYRAFGYVVIKNEWELGDIFNDDYCNNNEFFYGRDLDLDLEPEAFDPKEFNHIWVITSGSISTTNIDTGDVRVRSAGFCTVGAENQKGRLRLNILEPTTLFCLSANRNLTKTPIIPKTHFFSLEKGDRYVSDKPTRLFLASGKMSHGDTEFEGTSQIIITPNKEVVASQPCYGLVFE